MKMPAGTYYIGDLCYVMHDVWDEVCKRTTQHNLCLEGSFTLNNGKKFAVLSTAYGDGEYYDNEYGVYSVDSGTIGCIKVTDINIEEMDNLHLGRIVRFGTDFDVINDCGKLVFGHLMIDTTDGEEFED